MTDLPEPAGRRLEPSVRLVDEAKDRPMIVMMFKRPHYYLRNDPDSGWTLAVWKWRFMFNVHRGERKC